VLERQVDDGYRNTEGAAEALKTRISFDQHAPENKVEDERLGNPQFGEVLWNRRVKGGSDGCKRNHVLSALSCEALSAETAGEFTGCTLGRRLASISLVRFIYKLAAFVGIAAMCAGSDFAENLYKAGQKAERAGDTLHAYLLYARAAALDPANINYAERRFALQAMAASSTRHEVAAEPADSEDTDVIPRASASDVLEARVALPPPRLVASIEKKTFDLKGDARTVFEKVGDAYGIQVVFESDYQATPAFTFRMTDVGFEETFRALETVTNSFVVPVNARLALVVRDTAQKRADRAPAMTAAMLIPDRLTAQEAQEIITAVQQTLDIRRVSVDPTRHLVIMRDQATKIAAAQMMFASLSRPRPQIALDIEFLEVDKTSSLGYGMTLPNQLSIVNFGNFMNNVPSIQSAFSTFIKIGGGSTLFGLGITNASAFATLARSSAVNLLNAQVVSADGQAATLHVGNRYPIVTNGYYGNATGTGTVYTPPPTINYEDLGLVFKVTPSVHDEGEVTLDIDTEFKVLGASSSISGIPIISSRKYTGKVRLKEGEWAVLAGLTETLDSDVRTGIPGLMQIPWIGRLFSQNNIEHDTTEVLLVLKPHLTNLPPWETVSKPIWIGTETRPVTLF